MIRRLTILALTLVSVAVLAAWVAGCPRIPKSRVRILHSQIRYYESASGRAVQFQLPGLRDLTLCSNRGTLDIRYDFLADDNRPSSSRRIDLKVVQWNHVVDYPSTPWTTPLGARPGRIGEAQAYDQGRAFVRYRMQVQAWALLALTAAYPLIVLVRLVRRNRRSQNNCKKCNYDLTGNVTGRCSECGAEVRPASTMVGEHEQD